jgi:type I restriction enzyme S subunit
MTSKKMKDSGVEWIHKIPSNWQTTKVKRLGDFLNGFAFKPTDWGNQGLPIIRIQNLTNPNKEYNYFNDEIDNKYVVEKGDYLISWSATLDVFRWTGDKAVLNQHIFKVLLNEKIVDYIFFYWHAKQFIDEMSNHKHGSTMQHVTKGVFDNFVVALPPLKEQQKIAAFLDEKVAHIDNIIEETKKSIENLKAYKQSLITETVTKGLDTNVEMKDSDIKWIGELPANWQLVKLSRLTTSYSGGTPKRNEERYWKNGTIPWVSSGEVNKRVITESDEKISEEGLNESSAKLFPPKTVLVALNGQGKTKAMSALLEIEAATNQSLVGFIPNKLLNYKYLNFTFIASYSYNRSYYAGGNKRDGIAAGELKSRLIPLPSIDIQIEIVRFLEGKISHINSLILEKEQLINELGSYKKSFIYEYVTGKKEVK